ncbi:hypothetical protein GCM10009790_20220 [Georgenia ruanii]
MPALVSAARPGVVAVWVVRFSNARVTSAATAGMVADDNVKNCPTLSDAGSSNGPSAAKKSPITDAKVARSTIPVASTANDE